MDFDETKNKTDQRSIVVSNIPNPAWLGVKFSLINYGLFVLIGTPVLVLGVAGVQIDDILSSLSNYISILEIILSVYVGYVLYKNCSDKVALIAAILGYLILRYSGFSNDSNDPSRSNEVLNLIVSNMVVAMAFIIGWYVAKTTQLRLYTLSKLWLKILLIIGLSSTILLAISNVGEIFIK